MVAFLTHVIIMVAIFAIVALSLNLIYGMMGLSNYGQILFFAVGAYVTAVNAQHFNAPLGVEVLGALIAGALAGWLLTLPTRRLKQDFWALATFATAEVFRMLMVSEEWVAGGSIGTAGIEPVATTPVFVLVILAVLAVVFAISEHIRTSPFGRALRVIREDEVLAASLGRDVYPFARRVMTLGGAIAALAGVAYARYIGFVSPEAFTPTETFFIWTMVMLGGRGNNMGVVVGAATLVTINVSTRFIASWTGAMPVVLANARVMLYGALLVGIVLLRQRGIFPERKRVYRLPKQGEVQAPASEDPS